MSEQKASRHRSAMRLFEADAVAMASGVLGSDHELASKRIRDLGEAGVRLVLADHLEELRDAHEAREVAYATLGEALSSPSSGVEL